MNEASPGQPLTYASYLCVDDLLSLQRPRSSPPEHDETLFIIIHQTYELWFKQILHELPFLMQALGQGDGHLALHTFRRVLTILKTLVAQIDILETMTPVSFASFRSRLESASGFQSVQFRQVEIALGKRDAKILDHFRHDAAAYAVLRQMTSQPTVYDAFVRYLLSLGYPVPQGLMERDVREPVVPSPELRAILLQVYREQSLAAAVCERMVDLDEGLQEWRYRHVKMVERTLGSKGGTGGSSGADYLRSTLFKPLFEDLWILRADL
jgi:tryptophan 2,3-dioxygenase